MTSAVYARTPNLGLGLLEFNFPNWGDDENQNMKVIDAGFGLTGISVKGAWLNGTLYNAGDLVVDTDQNTIWRCQVTHTSALTGTFAADRAAHPTYWVDASQSLHARGQWATGVTYYTNDVVYENANKYSWALATRQFVSGGSYAGDVATGALVIITDTTQTVTDATAAKNAAQSSATAAASSASAASGSQTAAATSATNAANSASAAGTSATNAANSASSASTSATNAANSASSAATSASNALAIYNSMYPDAPSDGFTYGRKNGAWATVIGGASVQDTAPTGALQNGQMWWESDTGNLYIYYMDGTSNQWVQITSAGFADAPADGSFYGRVNGAWSVGYTKAAIDATFATKSYTDTQDALKVNKAGDTMTGLLALSGNPASALHAAPKQYVDTKIGNVAVKVYSNTSGTWTPTSASCLGIMVEIVGAGGGGGGAVATGASQGAAGGGGGSGAYLRKWYPGPFTNFTYVAADGGAGGGAGVAGTAGGQSNFGPSLVVPGGGGGAGGTLGGQGQNAYGGTQGTASGGDVNAVGQYGENGTAVPYSFSASLGARGAASIWGNGSLTLVGSAAGNAGNGYGGGGGGGCNGQSQGAAKAGGKGAPACIVVTEYY